MYEIMLVVFIIISLVIMILSLYKYLKLKQKSEEIIKKDIEKLRELKHDEYNEIYKEYTNKINILEKEFKEKQEIYNKSIEQTKSIIKEEENKKDLIIKQKQEIIDKELNEYKIKKEIELDKDYFDKINELDEKLKEYNDKTNLKIYEAQESLNNILKELEDYRKKCGVINEAIRREEELENEIDFHRIILSDLDKQDIEYLLSIEDKINNKDLLHKLIWSEYLQKPFNQMINNIFGSKIPKNVIYCIENIVTHKKYIGKTSAEVSKRWIEHIKSSLNIGGIKKQKIHDALFKHWDEYTFSILEITSKEQLNEKEKYYISFFETDKYGFNQKSGG